MSKSLSALLSGTFDTIFMGDISSIYATTQYSIRLPTIVGTAGQVLTTSGVTATNWSSVTDVIGILPVVNGGTGVALSTGTTRVVLSDSPTIDSPTLSGTLTLTTPLQISNGGTGVALSTGTTRVVLSDSPTIDSPTITGTITLSNPLQISNGGTGTSSSTGTGSLVLSSSPTLTTPTTTPVLLIKSNANKTVTINPFHASADYSLMLPETSGTAGQILTAGNPMQWADNGASNGTARWKQKTPNIPYCTVAGAGYPKTVTLEGVVGSGVWDVGVAIRANLAQTNVVEFGDYSSYGTGTILTSLPNTPSAGITRITFSWTAVGGSGGVANGVNSCFIIPAPLNGNSCTVTSNVVTYASEVLPGQWGVGVEISAVISGLYGPTDANDTLIENVAIITATPNTPTAGVTTITFPFTATDGTYIIKNIFPGAQQQTWPEYGGIDFTTMEVQADNRGLQLTVTPGNYGRFVNPYSFPVLALVNYNVARFVFTFPTSLPDQIPFASFLNGVFTVANGQTAVWLEANDNGIKLAHGAAPAAQPVNGTASIVLDPGEYFQLRGFNNSATAGGIWSGSEIYIFLTKLVF